MSSAGGVAAGAEEQVVRADGGEDPGRVCWQGRSDERGRCSR